MHRTKDISWFSGPRRFDLYTFQLHSVAQRLCLNEKMNEHTEAQLLCLSARRSLQCVARVICLTALNVLIMYQIEYEKLTGFNYRSFKMDLSTCLDSPVGRTPYQRYGDVSSNPTRAKIFHQKLISDFNLIHPN